jgi:acyl-coenzyme A synthetase/AMP-(fatty) acid ligase
MTKSLSEPPTLLALMRGGAGLGRAIATREHALPLDDFARASSLAPHLAALEGRSVLLSVRDMATAAAALIDLDGCARRIVLCPPGWPSASLEAAARDAEADALVHDEGEAPPIPFDITAVCRLPLQPLVRPRVASRETEWILPTSGTSGPPKLVVHTLQTLTGAIGGETRVQQWATFYDIRRYGGLQIFLRALGGRGSLTLAGVDESVDAFLTRLGRAGVTHVSGTPSHWRKVLMSEQARRIDPDYVRLSGEIADDSVLAALRALYPCARVEHAYASTEAGVAFAVDDGKAGFPAAWLDNDGAVRMRIVDGALHLRSDRRALRFLGAGAPELADEEDFVDTGDMVERRGDRLFFLGRRGGIINVGGAKVHPEEVEAALNAHAAVRASRVFARKNPITGALVVADVVLRDERVYEGLEREILAACRVRLPAHMTPAKLRFVAELPITGAGKLARHG